MHVKLLVLGLLLCSFCTPIEVQLEQDRAQCSVQRSKHARFVLQKYVIPKVERLRYQLPASCPLHPSRDMYAQREQAKVRRPGGHKFLCTICKDSFPTEDAWEQHFERNHQPDHDPGRDVCLADYCELLHCDKVNLTPHSRQLRAQHGGDPTLAPHAPCRESAAAQLQRSCRAVADACFTAHGGQAATKLHRLFVEGVCAAHTCDARLQDHLLEELAASERGAVGYKLLVGLALGALAIFYACLWMYYQYHLGFRSQGDVRRLRHSKASRLLELVGVRKAKAY
ncbi:g5749 [Coccomyxa elongata]